MGNSKLVVSRIFRHWQRAIFEYFCSKGSRKQILGGRKNKDTNQNSTVVVFYAFYWGIQN
jgi:hypothetical protein